MIRDLGTVYVAEIMRRLKSRPFIVGLVIGVFAIMLLLRLPSFLDRSLTNSNTTVLVGDPSLTARAKALLSDDYHIVRVLPPGPVDDTFLKAHKAGAAIVLRADAAGLHVTVYAHDPGGIRQSELQRDLLPLQLQLVTGRSAAGVTEITNIPVNIQAVGSKFASAGLAKAAKSVAYVLLFFLYLLTILNSQLVMASVAEEKTSRIAELLIASVNPSALLAGKVLASATSGFLQLAIWIVTAIFLGGGSSGAQGQDLSDQLMSFSNALDVITPGLITMFLIWFVIGSLQLSTLFAAAASLINRTEDLGSISFPLVMPVVAAFLIAITGLSAPDSPVVVACSYIPLLAPFVMFVRIAVSNVPLWQVGISLAINIAALYLIAVLAGKTYRVGMLLYGRSPSLRQIWGVLRT
ncbi:MAG TPA: ABC transporter permease [Candidatus Aquilonibacter sp.]